MRENLSLMKKYLIAVVVALVLFLAFGIYKVKERKEALAHLQKPQFLPYTVSVAKPHKGELVAYTPFRGKYEPLQRGVLSTKTYGVVEKVYFREGDSFKRGDILAKVDPVDLKTKLEAAKAKLSALKAAVEAAKVYYETQRMVYERNLKIYQTGGISKEQLQLSKSALEKAKAQYEQTLAELKATEAQVRQLRHDIDNYAYIRAPYDGVVDEVIAEEGTFVGAGRPILAVENTSKYRIVVAVPKDTPVGRDAILTLNGKTYRFEVSKVWNVSKNDLKLVEVDTPKLPIPSESYVDVKLATKSCRGYIVPFNALLYLDAGTFVVNVKKELIPVKVGVITGDKACVEGELSPQEGVIVAGQFRLRQIALHKYPIRVKGED